MYRDVARRSFFTRARQSACGLLLCLVAPLAWTQSGSDSPPLPMSESERAWLQEHPEVVVRISPGYPPFEFQREGAYVGMAVDYLDRVGARLNLKFVPAPAAMSWSEALERLRSRQGIDLILLITRTDERELDIRFTRDYISFPWVIFGREDGIFISGIGDLSGHVVAVEKGYVAAEWLRRDVPGVQLLETPDTASALEAVALGRADAYVGNLAAGSFSVEDKGLVNIKIAAPTPYGEDPLAMGVRKDWPELARLLDRALADMRPDEHTAIRQRWLSLRYEHGVTWNDVLLWVSLVAGTALAFILQLRRLVTQRTRHLSQEIADHRRAEEALEESQARYSVIFNHIHDALFIQDRKGRILDINQTAERLYGVDRATARTLNIVKHFSGPGNNLEQLPTLWRRMLDGESVTFEWNARRVDDGAQFPVEVWLQRVQVGSRDLILANVREITERKRQEQQRIQSQKMEAIGKLAGGIAHDFNNILFALNGFMELARQEAEGQEKITRYLDQSLVAGNRATALVRQILTFSRGGDQQRVAVDPAVVVGEALRLLRSTIPATVEIRQRLEATEAVRCDPTRLHQVLVNLCTNAYHAMQEHGGVLEVELTQQTLEQRSEPPFEAPPGRYVVIRVSDTGCGMSPELVGHIFDPYFTTKEAGKGTGLGLAVVHGIVKDLGGYIQVESAPGLGSTFDICLPATQADCVGVVATEVTMPRGGNERILVVDDESTIVDIFRHTLEREGYRVTSFTDGEQALDRILQEPDAYDLVITDMAMPMVSGTVIGARIRDVRPDLPVILCTGYSDQVNAEQALKAGFSAYLEKPVRMEQLLRAVRDSLDSQPSATTYS